MYLLLSVRYMCIKDIADYMGIIPFLQFYASNKVVQLVETFCIIVQLTFTFTDSEAALSSA